MTRKIVYRLNIKDPETHRLARELADLEHTTLTGAVNQALRDAYRRYGRGSGQPARLNFGDCFSYALARQLDDPLAFKGKDFSLTDIRPAS